MLDTVEWNKAGKVKAGEGVRVTVFNFMFRKGFIEKEQFRKEHFLKEVKGQASNLKGSKQKHAWCVLRLAKRPEWWGKNEWGEKNIKPIMMSFPGGTRGKEPGCQCRKYKRRGFDSWLGRSPEKGMAIHYNLLAWRIPWTEEPGGLHSMGSQRVRHNWSDLTWCLS